MKYRLFSRNSGLRVSEIGLGTGFFGSNHHGSKEEALQVFNAYKEAGGRFIDTAEGYQEGRSEAMVGAFVADDRNDFVIATKFAVGRTRAEGFSKLGNHRKAMMTAVEGSLRRLKTDYIDLYWLHAHDATTPMEEILRGFDDLAQSGKIVYGGLSNFPAWRMAYGAALADAKNVAPITAISTEYSLAERSAEREIIPMAEALGIGIGFWSPLGGGFLGRKNGDDGTPPGSHLDHWFGLGRPTGREVEIRQQLWESAAQLRVSAAQLAHAWLLERARRSPVGLVPILGASTAEQVTDVLAATALIVPAEVLKTLDAVSEPKLGEPYEHNAYHQSLTDGGAHYQPVIPVA